MARYTDTDKAIAHLKGECVEKYPASFYNGILASAKEISNLPTADVVPKSEYDAVVSAVDNSTKEFLKLHDEYQSANAEIERLKHILDCYALQYGTVKEQQDVIDKANQEFASEIFEEIEKIIQDRKNKEIQRQGDNKLISPFTYSLGALEIIEFQIAELKKKYTEGNNEL